MPKPNNNPNTTQIGLTNQSVFGLKYSTNNLCLYTQPKYNIDENVTTSFLEFAQRLNEKIKNIIDEDFNWSNVLIGGGLISGLLEKKFDEKNYEKSDIDLFVYGTKNTVTEKIIAIYDYFSKKLDNKFYAFTYTGAPMISIIVPGKLPIQIIGTEFNSADTVLKSFDMTHCQIGFDGNQIIYTDEFVKAMTSRITKITTISVHAYRLVKAHQRGYSIERPNYCYIKNIFHEYTTTFIFNKNNRIPSNTDKLYDINKLQEIISELTENPIVIKNLMKNYVPLFLETYDTQKIKNELDKIGSSYVGKDKYYFINDCDKFMKYLGNGKCSIATFTSDLNNNQLDQEVYIDIRDLLFFQRKLF